MRHQPADRIGRESMKKNQKFWWFENMTLEVPSLLSSNIADDEIILMANEWKTNYADWKACREQLWAEREGLA